MIYLLYGSEKYLIDKEIKNIISQNEIEPINTNSYDLNINLLNTIIDDCQMISLFSEKKAIVVYNSYIFTTKKNSIEQDTTIFESYLNNINPNTILIFVLYEDKLDERKKVLKNLKKTGIVKIFDSNININTLVKNMFSDYQISSNGINLLIDRVGKNLSILEQEISKIKTYKDNDLNVTEADIIMLTNKSFDVDIFALVEAIISKNKKMALNIYNEMLKYNEEPIKIIVMIANQFRIIYQSKEMYKKGYTESDIASALGIHPYRIKLALNKAREYSSESLLNYLKKLSDLDIDIKTGNINKEIGLELFIINL